MTPQTKEKAKCRGCGIILDGNASFYGERAYLPSTFIRALVCHYGGFVCSLKCDLRATLELEQSMPGHGYQQKSLNTIMYKKIHDKWENNK